MGAANKMTATGSKGRVEGGKRATGGHIPEGDSDAQDAMELGGTPCGHNGAAVSDAEA